DWLRSTISKNLERYEDAAFKAGQRAAGLTQGESRESRKQDEQQQHRMFELLAGQVEQLALCEVRTAMGVVVVENGKDEGGDEGMKKYLVVSPDCKPCAEIKTRVRDPSIVVLDVTTEKGVDFLERCMDEGVTFHDAPQAIVEEGGKLRLLKGREYPAFLGEKVPGETEKKPPRFATGSYGSYSK
ncbi:MAG: hypothetical protein ACREDF_11695, partial [Thermoplasmata archaeon]